MNTKKNMILNNEKDITKKIKSCTYCENQRMYQIVFHANEKVYSYLYESIQWMNNPESVAAETVQITYGKKRLYDIENILIFRTATESYWRIFFKNGKEYSFNQKKLEITHSCLCDFSANLCLKYLRKIAALNKLKSDSGSYLLTKYYEDLKFVGNDTALAVYLNPKMYIPLTRHIDTLIFPFGCNNSQLKAVRAALSNQMSVIQGPPGTGKTQTILNILSNIVLQGKTALVVSNNNSAIVNVLEKLSDERYGMGFIAAQLGNFENKECFIENQKKSYPDVSKWKMSIENQHALRKNIMEEPLSKIFLAQERLFSAKQEKRDVLLEMKHFERYCKEIKIDINQLKSKRYISSEKLLNLWQECQFLFENKKNMTFWFKLKCFFVYRIADFDFFKYNFIKMISCTQNWYYHAKELELDKEIAALEEKLQFIDAKKKISEFTEKSLKYMQSKLFDRYGKISERTIFTMDSLWKDSKNVIKEYPIILSTTFSAIKSLGRDAVFDYVIMDEASQVDVATGALALSCAKNAVIVGDQKQLPNVITNDVKKAADAIFRFFDIDRGYNYTDNSFLQSICTVIPGIHQTLLREHYRCHPKIIEFCNQKFYRGELIIMTEDHFESDVLGVFQTVVGNHARDHFNQRQVDVIFQEIIPQLQNIKKDEIGIITPYNNQINALKKQCNAELYNIATVHKFQGRENDVIILSTVDDTISDFVDDPFLLNVAVSRAKKQLFLVVSGNEQPINSNVGDLIAYIQYQNFELVQSKIYSIFDYLYQQYTENRFTYLKTHKRISMFDSENLMYGMIKDVLAVYPNPNLNVIAHLPLHVLIHDCSLLSEAERNYVMNASTHIDFLIYNRTSKKTVLAIEVDGFYYHKEGTKQANRDVMKNNILEKYEISYLRFATNGSGEKEKLIRALSEIV